MRIPVWDAYARMGQMSTMYTSVLMGLPIIIQQSKALRQALIAILHELES